MKQNNKSDQRRRKGIRQSRQKEQISKQSDNRRLGLAASVDVMDTRIKGMDSSTSGLSSDLDQLDRQIVALMQLDGRRSYASIARELNTSEGTVRSRVNQLTRDKILRVIAVVDPVELGYTSWALLGITVSPANSPYDLARYFAAQPEVTYVMVVAAKYDLVVEICCRTSEELGEFLEHHCHQTGKIASVETMVGLKLYKWFAPVPGVVK